MRYAVMTQKAANKHLLRAVVLHCKAHGNYEGSIGDAADAIRKGPVLLTITSDYKEACRIVDYIQYQDANHEGSVGLKQDSPKVFIVAVFGNFQ